MLMLQDDLQNRANQFRAQPLIRDESLADKIYQHGAAGDRKAHGAVSALTNWFAQDLYHILAARLERLDSLPRTSSGFFDETR